MGLKKFMERSNLDLLFKDRGELEGFLRIRYNRLSDWIYRVGHCGNDLASLVSLHRGMWDAGVRCEGLGPSSGGRFRCAAMDGLTLRTVYLGGVAGIGERTAAEFDRMKAGRPEMYLIACTQYRNILMENLEKMKDMIYDNGYSRKNIEEHIFATSFLAFHRGERQDCMFLRSVSVRNTVLDRTCIVRCTLNTMQGEIESSCLMMDYGIFLPMGFEYGVDLTKENIVRVPFYDVSGIDCWCDSGRVFFDGDETVVRCSRLSGSILDMVSRKGLFDAAGSDLRRQVASVRDKEEMGYRFGL